MFSPSVHMSVLEKFVKFTLISGVLGTLPIVVLTFIWACLLPIIDTIKFTVYGLISVCVAGGFCMNMIVFNFINKKWDELELKQK